MTCILRNLVDGVTLGPVHRTPRVPYLSRGRTLTVLITTHTCFGTRPHPPIPKSLKLTMNPPPPGRILGHVQFAGLTRTLRTSS